jgi:HlyD family secretion protein
MADRSASSHTIRRTSIVLLFLLALAAVGGRWWISTHQSGDPEWQGYAEADFITIGPTQQGLLTAVSVTRGDYVSGGTLLFTQDGSYERAARDEAAQQLSQSEGQLANLQSGGKPTEIQQAEANLADALAARDKIQSDLRRSEMLLPSGAASVQLIDQQRADLRSANAKVQAMEAALAQLRAPLGRDGEIKMQTAAVDASKAALAMVQWRLDQRDGVAPKAGVVADVLARPGETLAAGAPVVSLLPPENIFVRFFVPEAMLSRVHRGDHLALSCDNCPTNLTATVSFISPRSEYTPPVIYSEESKTKLVYLIEARPRLEQTMLLNPGQPVTVRPLAETLR